MKYCILLLLCFTLAGCNSCKAKLVVFPAPFGYVIDGPASSDEFCEDYARGYGAGLNGTFHLIFIWNEPQNITNTYLKVYDLHFDLVYSYSSKGHPKKLMTFHIPLDRGSYYIIIGSEKGQSNAKSYFWVEYDSYKIYTTLFRAALKAALHSPPIHALKEGARLLRFSAQPVQPAAAYLNQESQKCEQKKPPLHRAVEEQEPCESRELRHETRRICWRFLSAIT